MEQWLILIAWLLIVAPLAAIARSHRQMVEHAEKQTAYLGGIYRILKGQYGPPPKDE